MASNKKSVIYVGGATTREVTKDQWESVGVKDQSTVSFTRDNGFRVSAGDFTADALELLVSKHPTEFRVVSD